MSCCTVIWGRDKSGKTHLALTWPRPILLDNERRYQWVKPKFPAAQFVECKVPLVVNGRTLCNGQEAWQDHLQQFQRAASGTSVDTIIIDNMTRLREILLEASPPEEKRKPVPFNYSWSSEQIQQLVAMGRYHKKHLVLTHRATDERTVAERPQDRHPTGRDMLSGYQPIRYLGDMTLHLVADGPAVIATIEGCAWTKLANGLSVPEPSYAKVMAQIAAKLKEELVL